MAAGNRILEIKGGYNGFHWTNAPQDEMLGTREYRVPGLTIGAPYNYPQTLNQNNWTGRVDFSMHKEKHDVKMGGEYIHVHNGGPWFIQRQGFFTFNGAPANLAAVVPQDAALDPSKWNLAPLNPLARDFQVNFARNEERLDDRHSAADICDLDRRQLARHLEPDGEHGYSMGRRSRTWPRRPTSSPTTF